jgi:hypothetical protein
VEQRPPATSTFTIPEDSFLCQEDSLLLGEYDANILTSFTSPTEKENDPHQPMETESTCIADKLLSLRKNYKKTSVSLTKAEAHSEFLTACKEQQQTPKGLKVNVRCSAFLADLTNVKTQFVETTKQAEEDYVTHLNGHYDMVVNQLTQKQSILKDTMKSLEQQATREEKKCHQDMMTKTDNNVQKLSTELGKRQHRKLENISFPNPKRKVRQQDTRTQKGLKGRWNSNKDNHSPSPQPPLPTTLQHYNFKTS